ncbi:isatin hydrolase-like [Lineus longissimus]|uniref:isatin hydrolase-like n=1 Tax=Lineus longissimus TaxID=88925 RepID=UPI00315CA147
MSHDLREKMATWPGHTKYDFNVDVRGIAPGKDFYLELNSLHLSEHVSTHMDAPAHFAKGKWHVDQIPTQNIVGAGVVVDISDKAFKDPDAEVTVDDLTKWEETYGRIPDRAFVFMNSGWEHRWNNITAFLGNDKENTTGFHFPGFHPAATKWLVDNRDIMAIGVDSISLDNARTNDHGTHRYAMGHNVMGFEMVANLSRVPPRGSTIYALPMKVHDGSGAPVRILAVLNGAANLNSGLFMPLTMILCSLLEYLD